MMIIRLVLDGDSLQVDDNQIGCLLRIRPKSGAAHHCETSNISFQDVNACEKDVLLPSKQPYFSSQQHRSQEEKPRHVSQRHGAAHEQDLGSLNLSASETDIAGYRKKEKLKQTAIGRGTWKLSPVTKALSYGPNYWF